MLRSEVGLSFHWTRVSPSGLLSPVCSPSVCFCPQQLCRWWSGAPRRAQLTFTSSCPPPLSLTCEVLAGCCHHITLIKCSVQKTPFAVLISENKSDATFYTHIYIYIYMFALHPIFFFFTSSHSYSLGTRLP